MTTAALEIIDLHAWQGETHVLQGINLSVMPGEIVTLLGRPGSGRTSSLHAILGLVAHRKGSVLLRGTETISLPTEAIAQLGVGYCSQKRGIFPGLSCEENLLLPPAMGNTLGGGMSLVEIYDMFPDLRERRHSPGTRLSSGEQRMLAVARILRTGANLLLLDDLTGGLPPVIAQGLAHILGVLKEKGYTIIMVESHFQFTAPLADRFHIIEHGQIVDTFNGSELPLKQKGLAALFDA